MLVRGEHILSRIKMNNLNFFGRCYFSTMHLENVPVIKTPKYVTNNLMKLNRNALKKRMDYIRNKSKCGNLNIPIVTCKNSSLDHHLGQLYKRFQKIPLASQGWVRTKYWGDYFIINSYGENPSLNSSEVTFNDFNLNPRVLDAVKALGYTKPTSIQSLAIPELLEGSNAVCCAETGSGKTLAYLAPIIHNIMASQALFTKPLPKNTPLGLVLVPGRELGLQIGDMASRIAPYCGISVDVLIPDGERQKNVKAGSDLVIATIGLMCKLSRIGRYNVNNVHHIVVDECDTLVDDSFSKDLHSIFQYLKLQGAPVDNLDEKLSNCSAGAQIVLVGATIPRDIESTFEEFIDLESLNWIQTDYLHKIMPHVTQVFLRLDPEKKTEKLIHLLKEEIAKKQETNDKSGTVIFTNKGKACYYISKLLRENGIGNLNLQGESSFSERLENFKAFQNGNVDILVATDLGSRGLDTTRVKHVINFEFPSHISDYIHRVGRTGRVGSTGGLCTNFIGTKYEVPLVQQIETAARLPKAKALPNIDANIKRKIDEYYTAKNSTLPQKT